MVLIAASGLTFDEVAAISGAPMGAIKSCVYRARTALMMLVP